MNLIDRGCAVYSFDVFDTTLIRSVAKPKDVFMLMQQELSMGALQFPVAMINGFADIRVKAEFLTRVGAYLYQQREITIAGIYARIAKDFRLNQGQVDQLIDLELKLEHGLVYPVSWVLSAINMLRKKQKRIIFTSDMYLPLKSVQQMLIKVGAFQEGDRLYLSSDVGLKKFDGRLFKYILDQEGCVASQVCHVGDNRHSDVAMPRQLGMVVYQC